MWVVRYPDGFCQGLGRVRRGVRCVEEVLSVAIHNLGKGSEWRLSAERNSHRLRIVTLCCAARAAAAAAASSGGATLLLSWGPCCSLLVVRNRR